MLEEYNDICAFHEKFELAYDGSMRALPRDYVEFRSSFLFEEASEYIRAYVVDSRAGMLDALVDLAYVGIGTVYLHGFRPRPWSMSPLHVSPDLAGNINAVYPVICENIERYRRAAILGATQPGLEVSREAIHDVIFVARHAAIEIHHFQFDEAWRRVHAANMKKVRRATKRSGSYDVAKPKGWVAPDLKDLV